MICKELLGDENIGQGLIIDLGISPCNGECEDEIIRVGSSLMILESSSIF